MRFTADNSESITCLRWDCQLLETIVDAFQDDVSFIGSAVMKSEPGSTHVKCYADLTLFSLIPAVMNHYHCTEPVGAIWNITS
jgi:hypothetical protein